MGGRGGVTFESHFEFINQLLPTGGVTFIQSTGVIHHLKTRSIFCV